METETQPPVKKIHAAMANVMADIESVGKNSVNQSQGFKYRGIDAVMNEVHASLKKNRVFILQELLDAQRQDEISKNGTKMVHQFLKIRYNFTADDGSSVPVTVMGEALDSGDKAANKCMAIALKYALTQVFCIPTDDAPGQHKDPDHVSHELASNSTPVTPSKPLPEGALIVTKVDEKSGINKNKKAYTMFKVTLSDGRTATTFDTTLGKVAQQAFIDRLPVVVEIVPGSKEGYFDLKSLTLGEGVQADPPGDIPMDDEPKSASDFAKLQDFIIENKIDEAFIPSLLREGKLVPETCNGLAHIPQDVLKKIVAPKWQERILEKWNNHKEVKV